MQRVLCIPFPVFRQTWQEQRILIHNAPTRSSTDVRKLAFDAPLLLIGHRGAAGLEPENTLPSFTRAVALGVDAVELDVHVCDGRLCVIHDEELKRTTNGTGLVAEQSLAELRALDAGNGAQIPLLDEVFEVIPPAVGINVELKGPGTGRVLAELLPELPRRDVLVSSFNHGELDTFTAIAPSVPVAPLFSRWQGDPAAVAARLRSRFVNLSRKIVTADRCRALAAEGLSILVYTVNDPAEAKALFEMGVRGVFTDYPDRLRPIVRAGRSPA